MENSKIVYWSTGGVTWQFFSLSESPKKKKKLTVGSDDKTKQKPTGENVVSRWVDKMNRVANISDAFNVKTNKEVLSKGE